MLASSSPLAASHSSLSSTGIHTRQVPIYAGTCFSAFSHGNGAELHVWPRQQWRYQLLLPTLAHSYQIYVADIYP